jgi:single-stranded-DNA-specific exonuclease
MGREWMIEELIRAMERAILELRAWPEKTVTVFHHNDADGLSSGAILARAFEREGYGVHRFCLEKPYPEVLERVYAKEGQILILADFAGRIAPLLSRLNRGRNLTLILDHHAAEHATDPKVHNLDPDLFGLKGDRDIAAAATCFLFARTLNPDNVDLAHIGAVGAVGDKFFVDGRLVSQNREVTMEAVRQGRVEVRRHAAGEHYFLKTTRGEMRCDELGVYLDVLGGAGYYGKGPDMGVRVLLEGRSPESDEMVKALQAIQKVAFERETARLREGNLRASAHIQWFHVEDRFSPMGVKMVGLFCETVRAMDFMEPRKYIAGFQTVPNKIPGFGAIDFNQVKISMRVPPFMEEEIRAGRAMGLNTFLPEATNRLGGFSDACHSLTAATTVALGKEEALIEEMEKILGG